MSVSAERPFSVGQVVWTPTEDARENSLLGDDLEAGNVKNESQWPQKRPNGG